jgi:outer membrane immunogenic protein
MDLRRYSAVVTGLVLTAAGAVGAVEAADIAPAPGLWNGFYVGAQAGYLQGTGSNADVCAAANFVGPELGCLSDGSLGPTGGYDVGDNNMDGITAGGYLGYNYRIDSVVLGLEGDFNWDNADGNNDVLGEVNLSTSLNWDASVRARLGFVVDERALLYLTGGPSWINAEIDSNLCSVMREDTKANVSCGDSSTEFGWQLGAGAEYAITDHLSVKAEYLHGWYGDADLDLVKLSQGGEHAKYYLKQDLQTNVVRAGIAYHFGGI